MRRTVLVLALLAAMLPACGRKARPVPPEGVLPESADKLAAMATPDGVRLTWLRPTRYTGGGRMNDLGSFEIERATGDDPKFVKVGTLVLEDQERFRKERHLEWVDNDVRSGERYLYRVTAVTIDRYRSAPAGPIAIRFGAAPGESETETPPPAATP